MKSNTDLEQSKKLAEILPIESADMCWTNCYGRFRSSMNISAKSVDEYKNFLKGFGDLTEIDAFHPAWSLPALFNVLPHIQEFYPTLERINDKYVCRYKTVVYGLMGLILLMLAMKWY